MSAPVVDLGIERLVRIEERITTAEQGGLRARWEFGHELLAARDGKGRLPNGYLTTISEKTGASRRELAYRAQFAERYPTEPELCNALHSYRSWFDITQRGLAARPEPVVDPSTVVPVPEGVFRTLVADPPWKYDNRATRAAADNHYPTLTVRQLCGEDALPDGRNLVEDIVMPRVADEAHLYLWVTNSFLRDGFDIVEAWGFEYKTCLTWVKPQMGIGNYFRSSTEHVLFGVRGGLRTKDNACLNWVEAKRGKHSAKPERFYNIINKSSPGPHLEMFARCQRGEVLDGQCRCSRCRLKWEVWGNQA